MNTKQNTIQSILVIFSTMQLLNKHTLSIQLAYNVNNSKRKVS
jgi:hypothetical protein